MREITIRVFVTLTMILLTKKVNAMVSMELSAFCERSLLGVVVFATFLQDSAEDILSVKQVGCLCEPDIQTHLFDI